MEVPIPSSIPLGRSQAEHNPQPLRPPLALDAIKTNQIQRSNDRRRLPLLTSTQVAGWLGMSQRTVCLWAELEEIPAFKLGHQWRFREDAVRRWLEVRTSVRPGKRK